MAEEVYYFTDAGNSSPSLFYAQSTIGSDNVHVGQGTSISEFWNLASTWSFGGVPALSELTDAYIIFEVTEGFHSNTYYNGKIDTEILDEIFSVLKDNGCYIMFICNVDETRFYSCTNFLSYVDVHINTDMLTIFVMNIINTVLQQSSSNSLRNSTFIFDQNAAAYATIQGVEASTAYALFASYVVGEYANGNVDPWIAFDNNNINVYAHVSGTTFRNLRFRSFPTVEASNILQNHGDGNFICTIGSTIPDSTSVNSFWTFMTGFRMGMGKTQTDLPFYLYNPTNYQLADNLSNSENMQMGGYGLASFHYKIEEMITAFLEGYDMSNYDNWSGVCEVTRKPFSDNATGGWMADLQMVVSAWQVQTN